MKKVLLFFVAGLCVLGMTAYAAELNPLTTDRAETIGGGNLRSDIWFTVDSLPDTSTLISAPYIGLTWGVSDDTDFILRYGANLIREWPGGRESSGSGDLTVEVKTSPWKGPWGRLGISVATKLPDADDRYGLGTDEQDFFVTGLYTATLNKLRLNVNAGLAVVGDNTQLRHYDYLFAYGVGLEYLITDDWSIVAEVAGTTGGREENEISKATLGIVGPIGWGWEWAVTGSYGLTPQTPEWSAGLWLSRVWKVGPTSAGPFYSDERPKKLIYYPFPMKTEEAWTSAPNTLYGALAFGASGFGDGSMLYDAFFKEFRVGLAQGVDLGISWSYLFLDDSPEFGSTDGVSDLHVNFRVSPWQVGHFRFGIYSDVKLPVASFDKGLGTEKMDFTALALASFSYNKFAAHLNLGIAIDGIPTDISSQNDFFVAGIGAEYAVTDWASVFGEFYGKIADKDISSYMAGGGMRFLIGKYVVFASGAAGFADSDPDWTVTFGIMRLWDL